MVDHSLPGETSTLAPNALSLLSRILCQLLVLGHYKLSLSFDLGGAAYPGVSALGG